METIRYLFGGFVLDPSDRQLWRDGQIVEDIRPQEFDLLVLLVENAGRLVEKETLIDKIWGEAVIEDSALVTSISRLRQVLKAGDIDPIKAVPKKGYRFVSPVTVDKVSDGVKESMGREAASIGAQVQSLEPVIIRPRGFDVLKALLPERERAEIFLDLGRKASTRMIGSEQNTWLSFIEDEYESFGVALDYYGKTSASLEVELASHLGFYWGVRGRWAEGRERLRHALARQQDGAPESRAQALTWFGYLSFQLDDYEAAKQSSSEGAGLSKEIGDDATMALALQVLGEVAEAEGRYPKAKTTLKKSLAACQRAKVDWLIGRAYGALGTVARAEGNPVGAKEYYLQSLAKMEESDDKRRISSAYSRLSVVAVAHRDLAQARLMLDKSHETIYGTPGKQSIALAQFNLGLIEEASGQYQAALTAFQRSLALRKEIAEKRGVVRAMEAIGRIEVLMGNEKEAARIFGAAGALRTSAGAPMSPSEHKRYGALMLDVRKKFPQEWNDGRQKVLAEVIIV